ncbi:biliverdin-producing heme oxygenase [Magnetospirillum molischianum]|uniref:Putative Heme oxygenase n=1 Tax=Magnetospirillum molischianum DSM 120 TaxID=1150626 RepID=H8FQ19_MAGML|nr:biliverdin-producing heme oxygenase [Magnetospirillum molischianum]CCG40457.1 putative Heme oxygenase [Magnetospirillum molischianum DSM 120]
MTTGASLYDILRPKLREATKAAHHRIDHHPLMAPLVRGELTASLYGDALLALYCFHAPSERAFAAFLSDLDSVPPCRSEWLAADLESLGRTEIAASDIGPFWSGQPPSSPSEYIGMRYVIEGGSLGGRAILAPLIERLPSECKHITRFFDGQQDERDWLNFWTLADRLGPLDADETVRAAVRFFDEIEQMADRRWQESLTTASPATN